MARLDFETNRKHTSNTNWNKRQIISSNQKRLFYLTPHLNVLAHFSFSVHLAWRFSSHCKRASLRVVEIAFKSFALFVEKRCLPAQQSPNPKESRWNSRASFQKWWRLVVLLRKKRKRKLLRQQNNDQEAKVFRLFASPCPCKSPEEVQSSSYRKKRNIAFNPPPLFSTHSPLAFHCVSCVCENTIGPWNQFLARRAIKQTQSKCKHLVSSMLERASATASVFRGWRMETKGCCECLRERERENGKRQRKERKTIRKMKQGKKTNFPHTHLGQRNDRLGKLVTKCWKNVFCLFTLSCQNENNVGILGGNEFLRKTRHYRAKIWLEH